MKVTKTISLPLQSSAYWKLLGHAYMVSYQPTAYAPKEATEWYDNHVFLPFMKLGETAYITDWDTDYIWANRECGGTATVPIKRVAWNVYEVTREVPDPEVLKFKKALMEFIEKWKP